MLGVDSALVGTQAPGPPGDIVWPGCLQTAPPAAPARVVLVWEGFKSSCQTPGRERPRGLATMHGSCRLLLLLLAATVGPAGALSDDEKRAMVELHNLYRAQVSPPAADMLQMVSAARGTHRRGEGVLGWAPPPPDPSHP